MRIPPRSVHIIVRDAVSDVVLKLSSAATQQNQKRHALKHAVHSVNSRLAHA
ncbi:hypothetical protein MH117_13575 [Paenibacillus sp. ACRRX]|nr:hypothetical protein [Paenibacillus sp. ACRRX]